MLREFYLPEAYIQNLSKIIIMGRSGIKLLGLVFVCFSMFQGNSTAQTVAFPGAEGGGMHTTGGRGGKVIYVDNLNDKGNGSFRKAIEAEGLRTIVFNVSGNIVLNKPIYIKNGDLTIAGQSAPGDGICLVNYGISIEADNVIIRYLRVRPGAGAGKELDAISSIGNKNIIIDHCSFSWATDEVASFYENENFTMQWCIISESLDNSVHSKGNHGYGGIWGGRFASFHHNLICDHTSRNPRFHGSRYNNTSDSEQVDFRNNVIYNWGNNSIYGGEEGNYNLMNNYFKPGPATRKNVRMRILDLTQAFYDPNHNTDTLGAGKFYIDGNYVDGFPEVADNNWDKGVQGKGVGVKEKMVSQLKKPIPYEHVTTQPAKEAYEDVLSNGGCSFSRDDVDKRLIEEVISGTEKFGATFAGGGKGIIDSPDDVGGWPLLKQGILPADADKDGIPDDWEDIHRLNKNNADDGNSFSLNPDYTNLEVYLNDIVR